ncbi:MAG: STAS domain-containing protein [Polyangiaceae bacterium]|jgi:ABC-type transporter Mla MlaB component
MTMSLSAEGRFLRVVLEGELGVTDARAMFERLAPYAKADTVVVLSAAGVARADTAVVQLFAALGRSVNALEVESESDAWRELWRCVGLDRPILPILSGAQEA